MFKEGSRQTDPYGNSDSAITFLCPTLTPVTEVVRKHTENSPASL